MKLWEILIPVRDNEGNAYPEGTREHFLELLLQNVGGYSIGTTYRGAWRDESGITQEEYMLPVRIALEDDMNIEYWVNHVGYIFKQKAVMYTLLSNHSIIKHYD